MNFIVEIVITLWHNVRMNVGHGGGCADVTLSKG